MAVRNTPRAVQDKKMGMSSFDQPHMYIVFSTFETVFAVILSIHHLLTHSHLMCTVSSNMYIVFLHL